MVSTRLFALSLLAAIPLVTCTLPDAVRAREAVSSGHGFIELPIQAVHNGVALQKRDNPIPLDNYFGGYQYIVNITMGSDNQTVPVLFDTGSEILWVNPDCSKAEEYYKEICSSNARYNPLTSTTARILNEAMNITYGMGKVLGVYFKDTIKFGSATVRDQQFGIAVDNPDDYCVTGIIGAGLKAKRGGHPTFMQNLVDQGQVNSAAFGLDLRKPNETGSVILSGIDTKKYKCKLEKVPASGVGVYLTDFGQTLPNGTKITYPRQDFYPQNSTQGLRVWLDCGNPSNILGNNIVFDVAVDYPGAEQHFNRGTPFWTVPCDAPAGTFDFTFGETHIKVPYSDMVMREPNGNCQLNVVLSPSDGSVPMILGAPFLRGVYTVFDYERDNIWFGESANCGSNIVPIKKGEDGVPMVDGCACDHKPSSTAGYAPPPPSGAPVAV